MFAPEFRNRLDAIITFAHLSPEIIAKVVEKFVLQLEAQLGDRNVTIELSEEAARWLIASGYDELMGARPMARVIQEHIKKPLADDVLFGKLKDGGHVRVVVTKDEVGRDKLGFEYPRRTDHAEAGKTAGRGAQGQAAFAAAQGQAQLGAEGAAGKGLNRHLKKRLPRPGFAPGLRFSRVPYAVGAGACGCASNGAVRQVMLHGRSRHVQFDQRRLLRRSEIGVDLGVLSGPRRHLYRHGRAHA